MPDVTWIKFQLDMFDNKKIKFIRSLPEGSDICLCWIMLLMSAGKCNANGYIYLTESIPYNSSMLAEEYKININTVDLALNTFQKLNMIVVDDKGIFVPGWLEYQNIEGLDRVRELTNQRVKRHRENKKLLLNSNVSSNVTLTQSNAIELDKELELDKDIKNKELNTIKDKPQIKFVPPTVEEVKSYCDERKNNIDAENFVNHYEASNWFRGKTKIKNWKACVVTWEKNTYQNKQLKSNNPFLD